jgi:adenylosuccinate synthase
MATAVLGLQWGDEGKGKITHLLAREAELVVRFNGGPNAGHTVIDQGVKFGTHLVPAGVFYPGVTSALAAGVVIDPAILADELEAVTSHRGEPPRLLVAENAHLIMPYHRILEELEGSGSRFGTTRRGISPAYRDRVAHVGVRAGDLLRPSRLRERLEWRLDLLRKQWPQSEELRALSGEAMADEAMRLAEPWISEVCDLSRIVEEALDRGDRVLFEGAQGSLLDVDYGSYPFVTSSSTSFAGIAASLGIASPKIERRLGVAKAYLTRVGEGPFPTELEDDIGEDLQKRGGEFGVTTGRPRRCGWLDLVALRHAVRLNDATEIALTKLDVLSGLTEIKVCRAYRIDGETTDRFPLSGDRLEECVPVFDRLPGWTDSIDHLTSPADLPGAALDYIRYIQEQTGVPVKLVSVGPTPEETIATEL